MPRASKRLELGVAYRNLGATAGLICLVREAHIIDLSALVALWSFVIT